MQPNLLRVSLNATILIVHRTPSDRTPNATRSGGGRNLIGRRTQSNRTPNAIQSDTERNPTRKLGCSIRKDTPKDWHRLDF